MAYGREFFAVELEAYRLGVKGAARRGYGTRAHGTPRARIISLESTTTVRASDVGYRSRATDAGGVQVYPPTVETAFDLTRDVQLAPGQSGAGFAFGVMRLSNVGRLYDSLAYGVSVDGRTARVLMGRQLLEEARGILIDPAYSSLVEIFRGVSRPWTLTEEALEIPLRDPSYRIEGPIQPNLYLGTGQLEGGTDLKGRPKPRVRGGSAAAPVRNLTPIWVDRANGILQVSDAPGVVAGLAENGDPNQIVPYMGNADGGADPYAYGLMPGTYRYYNVPGKGLFIRLGSNSTLPITVAARGQFPSGTLYSDAASIALAILLEDFGLTANEVDVASFQALAAAYPWTAGDYWDGGEDVTGDQAVGLFLLSIGARLVPTRTGKLRAIALRALPANALPDASFGLDRIVSVKPVALPEDVSPQPFRFRVGYLRNNTVQTDGLDVDVTPERRAFLAEEYRTEAWVGLDVARASRKPNDPPMIPTRLLVQADALALANSLGALWVTPTGTMPRTLYEIEVPRRYAWPLDFGSRVRVTFPLHQLTDGKLGFVVGETLKSKGHTTTLRVLI